MRMAIDTAWNMPARRAGRTAADSQAIDDTATGRPAIRRIGLGDLGAALRAGIDDFLAIPTQLFFLGLIYPLVGLIAARAAWGGDILALLWPMVAGLSLLGPVAAMGLTGLSRRRERGEAVHWTQAFSLAGARSPGAMLGMTVLLASIFLLWLAAAHAIYAATLGPQQPVGLGALAADVFGTPAGRRLLLFGNLVGFGFAVLVLAISVVSLPLLLDRRAGLATAIGTSLRACATNPGAMAVWGLIVAAALALGCIPLFVGLAVAVPVLGHATWHLYRRVVV